MTTQILLIITMLFSLNANAQFSSKQTRQDKKPTAVQVLVAVCQATGMENCKEAYPNCLTGYTYDRHFTFSEATKACFRGLEYKVIKTVVEQRQMRFGCR